LHYYEFFVDLLNNRTQMKTINLNHTIYAITITISVGFTAEAQKLPTVQQAGLYAPANVKVDGKTTEWGNKFQAYNKNTSVFYTMANDADNLYLVLQATDRTAIDKILTNKLTLSVFNDKDKNILPVTITTPSMRGNSSFINSLIKNPSDSLVNLTNKAFDANFKELKVTGISAISDPTISVYNDYGIKFAGRVDANKAYTCELAIPIKNVNHLTTLNNLSYKIQLNGLDLNGGVVRVVVNSGSAMKSDGGAAPANVNALFGQMAANGGPMGELMSDTNFTGTYTLVKNR